MLEVNGGDYALRSVRTLRPGGLRVTAVERMDSALAARVEAAGRRFAGVAVEPDYVALEKIAQLVDAGRLVPHVEHALPLIEAARDHALLDGRTRGKIVLTV